jgi:hypothetical protein
VLETGFLFAYLGFSWCEIFCGGDISVILCRKNLTVAAKRAYGYPSKTIGVLEER